MSSRSVMDERERAWIEDRLPFSQRTIGQQKRRSSSSGSQRHNTSMHACLYWCKCMYVCVSINVCMRVCVVRITSRIIHGAAAAA